MFERAIDKYFERKLMAEVEDLIHLRLCVPMKFEHYPDGLVLLVKLPQYAEYQHAIKYPNPTRQYVRWDLVSKETIKAVRETLEYQRKSIMGKSYGKR